MALALPFEWSKLGSIKFQSKLRCYNQLCITKLLSYEGIHQGLKVPHYKRLPRQSSSQFCKVTANWGASPL